MKNLAVVAGNFREFLFIVDHLMFESHEGRTKIFESYRLFYLASPNKLRGLSNIQIATYGTGADRRDFLEIREIALRMGLRVDELLSIADLKKPSQNDTFIKS